MYSVIFFFLALQNFVVLSNTRCSPKLMHKCPRRRHEIVAPHTWNSTFARVTRTGRSVQMSARISLCIRRTDPRRLPSMTYLPSKSVNNEIRLTIKCSHHLPAKKTTSNCGVMKNWSKINFLTITCLVVPGSALSSHLYLQANQLSNAGVH